MLDYELTISVSDQAWDAAKAHATLEQDQGALLANSNVAAPLPVDSRRRYCRVLARGRALAIRGTERYGVITTDVSPIGIGFFSPIQLLPKEVIVLCFEPAEQIVLEIRRCARTENKTYSCGGNFANGPLSPAPYRDFLAALRA